MPAEHQVYRFVRKVYQGAISEVWWARTIGPDPQNLAVKRPSPAADAQDLERFAAEVALHTSIRHPRVVAASASPDDGGGSALVMPFMAGGSLRDLLDARGTLTPAELLAVMEAVVDGIEALQGRGLVHGDLKPANILLAGDGAPAICDLGSARPIGGRPRCPTGTPAYADPAVADGAPDGTAGDVFSLGVIAYEALTGRLPHRGSDAEVIALAAAGAHRRLDRWPGIGPGIAEAIEVAIQPDPRARPRGPREFLRLFAAEVTDMPRLAEPAPILGLDAVDPDREAGRTVSLGPRLAPPNEGRRRLHASKATANLITVGLIVAAVLARIHAGV